MKGSKWEKQRINGKWYSVYMECEHVPLIEHLKTGEYKVKGPDGKPRIEKNIVDAQKFALETYHRMVKFNKNWDKKEEKNASKDA